MDDMFGSTVAKRRLSRRITELRIAKGDTANQVCDRLSWGRGKVGRFEANAWKQPELSDVRDLLRLYDVSGPDRADLENLAKTARQRQWWRDYGEIFGDSEYPGYEADAVRICVYMPLILPGLLQTEAYANALMGLGSQPVAWRERALEARLRRQLLLDQDPGYRPELVAVITEASLLYRWGTKAQRRAQLDHLVDMGRRDNVELRLLRFSNGPHPGMSSLISIFDFPQDEPSVVFLESDAGIQEVHVPKKVDAHIGLYGSIQDAALSASATTAYLKQLTKTLE